MPIPPDIFRIDRAAQATLQAQIQRQVADGVLAGRFRPGDKLPSSRALARYLGTARITVTLAYTELLADAYLTAKGRSGYFISDDAPAPRRVAAPARQPAVDWPARLPERPPLQALVKPADWRRYRFPFIYGQADQSLFDHTNWRRAAVSALGSREFAAVSADLYDRDDPMLVEYLCRTALPRRGILAEPDEILLTLGAQNALWLTAQLVLGPGRRAAMEEPGYPGLRDILAETGCTLAPVPVDAEGMPPEAVPKGTDIVFLTPGHQCPSGTVLPETRRQAFLDLARDRDLLLVEDDYDFELAAAPPPSLKARDGAGRVIHVGSFSKTLFPGLRLGYLVGAVPFIAEARRLRATQLRHPPAPIQRTLALFLSAGHYDALMRRTARTLGARRRALDAALAGHGLAPLGPPAPGASSLWLAAPEGTDSAALARRLQADSVLIEPGTPFFAAADAPQNRFRLAVTSIPEAAIAEGIARLAAALQCPPTAPWQGV